ncbi:MAG: OmpA family protein [candidate division Zixibacteria bacterium]|nr:OmpA family protein [candidate division Zixibacteria bacterium]
MRKAIFLSVLLIILITMSLPVLAYDQTGRLGLGYRFGIHSVMKDPWAMKFMHGGEVRFGLCPYVSLGITGTYGRTDGGKLNLSLVPPTFVDADADDAARLDLTSYILEIGPVFSLMPNSENINIYLALGAGFGGWSVRDINGNQVKVPDLKGNLFELGDQQLTVMFGGGLEYYLIEEFSIGFSARYHVYTSLMSKFENDQDIGGSDGLDIPTGLFEAGVNITAYLGKCKDDDKDGVCNDDDRCLDTPENCIVDEFGCPIDSDGDGVCDGRDLCPNTPPGCKVDLNGCLIDSDGDGVCDGVDRCPNTQKGCKVDRVGCALDGDKDGVPDCRDKCPDTPTCCKVNADGCELDSDNDGVCDGCDKCPGTPPGYEVDKDGCPTGYDIERERIMEDVTFTTNLAVLSAKAKKALDRLVEALEAMPHVELQIYGHTDNTDGFEWNMELSRKRVDAVVNYFVEKGLDKSRFTTEGFGDTKPKADNKTSKGRQANRRVEFHRVN